MSDFNERKFKESHQAIEAKTEDKLKKTPPEKATPKKTKNAPANPKTVEASQSVALPTP